MLDRFRQGDANAFASLYRTHWNQVFRFSRLYLKNDEDAEDVVQEVFIRGVDMETGTMRVRNMKGLATDED